ncbi:MAG TPA: hypoxanthine phosphoribosyltransferase [Myxococcales bacterium]|nr:hypoxanthine phosphoribosyltransferase [Myxococcales bacterium]
MKLGDELEVLYTQQQIAGRVRELAAEIERDHRGKELVLVGVLKGAFMFVSDLARQIDLPLSVDFIGLSSYGEETESSGVVKITSDLTRPIEGKHVIIVEDIVDTGLTMRYLLDNFSTRRPASVKICALLQKPSRLRTRIPIQYLGFTVPDLFVVGYGLDSGEKFRNLPFIGATRKA